MAVVVAALARMAGLVVKYPPLDGRRAALLRAKEAACARLFALARPPERCERHEGRDGRDRRLGPASVTTRSTCAPHWRPPA